MHPSLSLQLATINQRRLLDAAAADRLARTAKAGRRSSSHPSSLLDRIRRGLPRRPIAAPDARPTQHGRA